MDGCAMHDTDQADDRHLLPLISWGVTLAVAIVLFTLLGNGQLAAPPLTDPGAWGDWLGDRDPVVAVVAILRLFVLAMAWYLVGVTTIGAVARLADIAALVTVADALSIPVVRRVLQSSLGVGLATAVVSSSVAPAVVAQGSRVEPDVGTITAAAALEDSPGPPGMRALDDAATTELPGMRALDDADASDLPAMHALDDTGDPGDAHAPAMRALDDTGSPDVPTMHALGDAPPPPGMRPLPDAVEAPTADAPPLADPVATDEPPPAEAPDQRLHTVESGDHLWSIAEAQVAAATGTDDASDDRIAAYWQRLIDANRDRLVDSDNPDLILPGQEFVLPDVEEAP